MEVLNHHLALLMIYRRESPRLWAKEAAREYVERRLTERYKRDCGGEMIIDGIARVLTAIDRRETLVVVDDSAPRELIDEPICGGCGRHPVAGDRSCPNPRALFWKRRRAEYPYFPDGIPPRTRGEILK